MLQAKAVHGYCAGVLRAPTPPPRLRRPFQVPGTVSYLNSDKGLTYPACSREFNGRTCQKKLGDQGDGTYYCERCGGVSSACSAALAVLLLLQLQCSRLPQLVRLAAAPASRQVQ